MSSVFELVEKRRRKTRFNNFKTFLILFHILFNLSKKKFHILELLIDLFLLALSFSVLKF